MIGNMLNDLAKAIRRWTEKKIPEFSLQMNNILSLSVTSISIKARMRIAIDLRRKVVGYTGLTDW